MRCVRQKMLRVLCSGYFFVLLNILIILFMLNEIFYISDILNMNFKIKKNKGEKTWNI